MSSPSKLAAALETAKKNAARMTDERDGAARKLADAKAAAFADPSTKTRNAFEQARKDLEFASSMLAEAQREADEAQAALVAEERAALQARFDELAGLAIIDEAEVGALAARAIEATRTLDAIDKDARSLIENASAAATEMTELRAKLGIDVPMQVRAHRHVDGYVQIRASHDLDAVMLMVQKRVRDERNRDGSYAKRLGLWIDSNG